MLRDLMIFLFNSDCEERQQMKRTSHINLCHFRKSRQTSCIAPIALVVTATFMLGGCKKDTDNQEEVNVYQSGDDCGTAQPLYKQQCRATYQAAINEAEKTAPKYATREDCEAEFGSYGCVTTTNARGETQWMPRMEGYLKGHSINNGSSFATRPLFIPRATNSPANWQFVDAAGHPYGSADYSKSFTLNKNSFTPIPSVNQTIVRGGFGETITQNIASSNRPNQSSGHWFSRISAFFSSGSAPEHASGSEHASSRGG
jgi:uncharacterized protein YgiB involved in biofilm formation